MITNFFSVKTKAGLVTAALSVAMIAGFGSAQAAPQEQRQTPGAFEQMHRMFGAPFAAQREAGGWMGVAIEEVTADKAKDLKLKEVYGVLVSGVEENSPAAKAGLKKGDVVTEYNGQRVDGAIEFRRLVHETPAGRVAQLSIWRDGHAQKISVEIAQSRATTPQIDSQFGPDFGGGFPGVEPQGSGRGRAARPENSDGFFGPRGTRGGVAGAPRLGVAVQDMNAQLGSYFGVPDGDGVLITEVRQGSAGEKAGLKAGDVITKIDNDRVHNLGDLRQHLRDKRDAKSVTLAVVRKGVETSVTVEPEKSQAPGERSNRAPNNSDRRIPL